MHRRSNKHHYQTGQSLVPPMIDIHNECNGDCQSCDLGPVLSYIVIIGKTISEAKSMAKVFLGIGNDIILGQEDLDRQSVLVATGTIYIMTTVESFQTDIANEDITYLKHASMVIYDTTIKITDIKALVPEACTCIAYEFKNAHVHMQIPTTYLDTIVTNPQNEQTE